MTKRSKAGVIATDRDKALIFFLWKWKVGTTAALCKLFYPGCSPATAYNRLLRLEKGGFVESRANASGSKFIWLLGARGFAVAKENPEFPEIEDDGYKSEHPGHDLLVATCHLGDWILGVPENCAVYPEQYLRRIHRENYPEWVPRLDIHRPDGWWRVWDGKRHRLVALEIELHLKSRDAYDPAKVFYDRRGDKMQILWVVTTPARARSIQKCMGRIEFGESDHHSFVLLSDFLKNGWRAEIILGQDTGKTLRQVLSSPAHESLGSAEKLGLTQLFLDLRKSPHKSKTSAFYELGDFAN